MSENLNLGDDARLNAEELEIERALQSLAPAEARVNRDAMMFAAGKAAASRRGVRFWQAACLAIVVGCTGFVVYRPVRTVERDVIVHVPVAAPVQVVQALPEQMGPVLRAFGEGFLRMDEPRASAAETPQADYLSLRRAVLRDGLDALPAPKVVAGKAAVYVPAKKDDLFDALPRWQRQQLTAGGQL